MAGRSALVTLDTSRTPIKPRCGFVLQDANTEARRAGKITAGGITPGSMASGYRSAEGAAERAEWLFHPVGVGVPLRTVSRGFTPACGLVSPSGFPIGTSADSLFYSCLFVA